jgi:hypothetical protein
MATMVEALRVFASHDDTVAVKGPKGTDVALCCTSVRWPSPDARLCSIIVTYSPAAA